MSTIRHVHARQILDSRGNPTVEVDVRLSPGSSGGPPCPRARRPAREAVELRDGDGRASAARASRTPSTTSTARSPTAVSGRDAADQAGLTRADRARRHRDKSRLGANAILGVSLAVARAAAADAG